MSTEQNKATARRWFLDTSSRSRASAWRGIRTRFFTLNGPAATSPVNSSLWKRQGLTLWSRNLKSSSYRRATSV